MRTTTCISFRVIIPSGSIYPATIVRPLRGRFLVIGPMLLVVGALYSTALSRRAGGGALCMLVGYLTIRDLNDYVGREDDRRGIKRPFWGLVLPLLPFASASQYGPRAIARHMGALNLRMIGLGGVAVAVVR